MRNVQFANGTIPLNWMNRMLTNVDKLCILGGNLRHIPPTAFLGQFAGNLRTLIFEDITITSWNSDTFVGLSNLEQLMIKNSVLVNVQSHAIRAIHETIDTLTITNVGKWNPTSVAGYSALDRLKRVDFSQNDFGDIINRKTFRSLNSCKVLFLNSCKITAIGVGSFDSLKNIEMLFLNDNYLVTVPPALFTTILNIVQIKPRIHLQDNRWKCDCSQNELIKLSKNDLLLVDPDCYYPDHMNGKPFSKLESYCRKDEDDIEIIVSKKDSDVSTVDTFTGPCVSANYTVQNTYLRIISPIPQYQCQLETIRYFERISQRRLDETFLTGETKTAILKPNFLFQSNSRSMMQVGSSPTNGYGLIWYRSACPNEVFCVNILPDLLRVYNIIEDDEYTFCPINLSTAVVDTNGCIFYNSSYPTNDDTHYYKYLREHPVLYVATALLCLIFGALCVYGVIRKNPSLLKGSKRLLFVKHRNVDALVLPPKIPLRSSLTSVEKINFNENRIFTVQDNNKLCAKHFLRSNSVRSDKSNTPTYVSAMQPTEVQLAEWRIRNHFDKTESIISISSGISKYSWICESCNDSSSNILYESLK